MGRIVKIGVVVVLAAAAAFGMYQLRQMLMIGAGYYAKTLCSGVFVSGRPADSVIAQDVFADQSPLLQYYSSAVDRDSRFVDVWVLASFAWQRAVYRDGYGCHLALDVEKPEQVLPRLEPVASPDPDALWPEGQRSAPDMLPTAARQKLSAALEKAFTETDPERKKRTRAVVVVHKGRLVAERYADGFTPTTAHLGWSMAKSVTNALAGVLAAQGHIAVTEAAPVGEWRGEDDPRRNITLDDLLRMSSGLEFGEDYDGMLSDVRVMLFARGDKAAFAARKPLICEPGTCWYYSSGTSNIVAASLQSAAENATAAIAHELLFQPLGMHTAVFEPDASGTLVGSSYVYASARDWARLGLLYLQGGKWDEKQIFTPEWLDYTLEPSPGSDGRFGAHLWLRPPRWNAPQAAVAIPKDDFYFLGHDGQMVAIIPSRQTVIVRLGLTRFEGPFDHARLVRGILEALPE